MTKRILFTAEETKTGNAALRLNQGLLGIVKKEAWSEGCRLGLVHREMNSTVLHGNGKVPSLLSN